jgi:hypothetical protein
MGAVAVFSRRELLRTSARLAGLGIPVCALPALGGCQFLHVSTSASAKLRRVGFLELTARAVGQPFEDAFVDQLH